MIYSAFRAGRIAALLVLLFTALCAVSWGTGFDVHGSGSSGGSSLGTSVLTCGPGCQYSTIQAAVIAAVAITPSATNPVTIQLAPGVYDQDTTELVLPAYVSISGPRSALIVGFQTAQDGAIIKLGNGCGLYGVTVQNRPDAEVESSSLASRYYRCGIHFVSAPNEGDIVNFSTGSGLNPTLRYRFTTTNIVGDCDAYVVIGNIATSLANLRAAIVANDQSELQGVVPPYCDIDTTTNTLLLPDHVALTGEPSIEVGNPRLAVTAILDPTSPSCLAGIEIAGNSCRVIGCEVICSQYAICTKFGVTQTIDDLIVRDSILHGGNFFYPGSGTTITRAIINNNDAYTDYGGPACQAPLDISAVGIGSHHVQFTNNHVYLERSIYAVYPPYLCRLTGSGHTVQGNTVRVTVNCGGALFSGSIGSGSGVAFVDIGGSSASLSDQANVIADNTVDVLYKNAAAGVFRNSPLAVNVTTAPSCPYIFRHNSLHIAALDVNGSVIAPSSWAHQIVPGFNTQLTASMPTMTIYPDGLFGAFVAGADFSATGNVANLNIPVVWPNQPTTTLTTANIDRAHLLAAFGDAKLLGSGWRSLVFDSSLSTYKIVTSDGSQFHVQSVGAAFGSGL